MIVAARLSGFENYTPLPSAPASDATVQKHTALTTCLDTVLTPTRRMGRLLTIACLVIRSSTTQVQNECIGKPRNQIGPDPQGLCTTCRRKTPEQASRAVRRSHQTPPTSCSTVTESLAVHLDTSPFTARLLERLSWDRGRWCAAHSSEIRCPCRPSCTHWKQDVQVLTGREHSTIAAEPDALGDVKTRALMTSTASVLPCWQPARAEPRLSRSLESVWRVQRAGLLLRTPASGSIS